MELIRESEFSALVSATKVMRNKSRPVPSLMCLCMKSIAENESTHWQKHPNAFKFLPKTVVKKILFFVLEARKAKRKFVSKIYLDFILLLLNEQATEFDFTILPYFINPENEPFEKIKMACVTLHHLQKNCPKITSLKLYWPRHFLLHLPWENLVQWNNLRFLGVNDFICDPKTVRLILKNHPKLEGLEFSILHRQLNSECVGYLSEMKSLKYLKLLVTKPDACPDSSDPNIPSTMANIACKVPNLATFHFHHYAVNGGPSQYPDGFVEKFQMLCQNPDKAVRLLELDLGKLEISWPKSLSVEKLVIYGYSLELSTIKHLGTVPQGKVNSLVLVDVENGQIYKLLRIFGPTLKQLGIVYHRSSMSNDSDQNLNIFKIISLCPNMERFYTDEFASADMSKLCLLSPQTFSKMKTFAIYHNKFGNIFLSNRVSLRAVYKMFILGSKFLDKKLHVFIADTLAGVADALEEDPECLKDLRELHVDVQFSQHVDTLTKVGKMVMQRAPFLEKIKIGCEHLIDEERLRQQLPSCFLNLAEALDVIIEIEETYKRPNFFAIYSDHEF